MTRTVAALYIDPRGPYPRLEGVECWDETRDARVYEGPHPVVAHPPCGPWGNLRHLSRGEGRDCAPLAVEQVRRFGGVLEHPRGSQLWAACGLPLPGELPDEWGGRTIEVEQVRWGHNARKRTWLYLVGISDAGIDPPPRAPTHWVSGGRVRKDKRGGTIPAGIKVCSAQQRRRTPPAFAEWLIGLARNAVVLIAIALASCGYSEAEMQLARDRQHRTESTLDGVLGQLEQCQQQHDEQEATDAGSE